MPKLTWMNKPPKVNRLEACLKMYKRAAGMTSDGLGAKLGCTGNAVRQQLRKRPEEWNIGALLRYCEALGCPPEEAFKCCYRA